MSVDQVKKGIALLQESKLLGRQVSGGDELIFHCPFVDNHGGRTIQESPSFSINKIKGAWHCWNPRCGRGGMSIHSLYIALTGKSSDEAKVVIGLPETKTSDLKKRIASLGVTVVEPVPTPKKPFPGMIPVSESQEASDYLMKRGIPPHIWEIMGLGYYGAPTLPDSTIKGRRIIFPIHFKENLVGYSSRALDDDNTPKYYRPIQALALCFYDPLGLLNQRRIPWLVIVEGEISLAACLREGLPAVGNFGSYIPPTRAAQLLKADKVTLMFDGDTAGQEGALKSIDENPQVFRAKFLDTDIVQLPTGLDPAQMNVGFGVNIRATHSPKPKAATIGYGDLLRRLNV